MLRWLTAGESHGPALVAVLEGLPAGVSYTPLSIPGGMNHGALVLSAAADAKIIYVNGADATSGNGTTWAASFKYLQDALKVAVAGDSIYMAINQGQMQKRG